MPLNFWARHLILPLCVLILIMYCIEAFQLDMFFERYLYQLQGGSWLFKKHWLLENILHTGAKNLIVLITVCLILIWLVTIKYPTKMINRQYLGYLLVSAITSVAIICVLKKITQVGCPWHLQAFGGDLLFYSIYQTKPINYPNVNCFPAGHASAAYAWFGIFYILTLRLPKYRFHGLASVLLLGLILGMTQQIRGAHFISHDIWTLTICWLIATLLSPMVLTKKKAQYASFNH